MEDINQPVAPPQTPDQMHSSFENSHNSKVVPFIIVAVLLILVGAGSYVLGTKKSQPITESKVISQPSPTLSPTPTPDPTANWKTYNEKGYKFLVKYPDGWIVSIYDYKKYPVAAPDQPQLIVDFKNKTVMGMETGTPGFINISIIYIKPNVSFTEFLKQEKNTANISTPKPLSISDDIVNVSSIQAHKIKYKYYESTFTQVYIPKEDGSIYMIGSSVLNEDLSLREKFLDQILSTFKFTN